MLHEFNIPRMDTTSVNPIWQQDQSTLQRPIAMLAFYLPKQQIMSNLRLLPQCEVFTLLRCYGALIGIY